MALIRTVERLVVDLGARKVVVGEEGASSHPTPTSSWTLTASSPVTQRRSPFPAFSNFPSKPITRILDKSAFIGLCIALVAMPPSARPTLQSIPQGARSPAIPSPIDSWTPYLQAAGSPEDYPSYRPYSASSNTGLRVPEQPIGRSSSLSETGAIPFPEPQLGRSVSYASSLLRGHRRSSTASSTTSTLSRSESLDYVLEVRSRSCSCRHNS